MKKIALFIALCNFATPCFSTEILKAGQSFKAKEDSLVFTIPELNKLKEKIDSAEKNERLLKEYQEVSKEYEKMRTLQNEMLSQYRDLDKMKQESITIYKEAVTSYKGIIEELQKNNEGLQGRLASQRKSTRFQRNLNFVIGFAAPLLGARAMNWVK